MLLAGSPLALSRGNALPPAPAPFIRFGDGIGLICSRSEVTNPVVIP